MPRAGRTKGGAKPAARLTWRQAIAWRLRRHRLDRRAPREALLEVVADLCGVHAQLMSSAELTLWARVEDLEPEAVQQALWEERSLVKTWAMRGTLHLLPAAEYRLWQAGLSTYEHYLKAVWLRAFEVTRDELEALLAAVGQALDGHMLAREELAAEVSRLTSSPELGDKLRESWGALLKPASFRGLLCYAPSRGQNVRFTRPDRWLPELPDEPDPDAAPAEIARRFLAVHGPATREDFARWWGGLTPAASGRLIAGLGEEAAEVEVGRTRAWMLTRDVVEAADGPAPRSVRLLPAFDQYVIAATRHAAHLLPGAFRDRVYRKQGWVSPVLLVDGRMDGVWRQERKHDHLVVEVEPFAEVPARARRAAQEEAERLAAFTGAKLELSWRP